MARYWVYLNDEVSGPYAVEQLIRLRGFSRQTMVCFDDSSGKPNNWISPAEIPELAHIFKAADEHMAAPPPKQQNVVRPNVVRSNAVRPNAVRPNAVQPNAAAPNAVRHPVLPWIIVALLLAAGGIYAWFHHARKGDQAHEQTAAKALVENARLPASSVYPTLKHYIQEKQLKPRWEFEKAQDALYHVTLSWYAQGLSVYAFEANVQAQTVRGLNTAASKLLSEGFPAPASAKPKASQAPKESPAKLFDEALENRRAAFESGDFPAVWDSFSPRKRSEMARGGISRDGFLRLQGLTRRVESAIKQTVLKTQATSETEMLVLIKQTQADKPDIFVKQLWLFENGAWALDDEQKRSAQNPQNPAPEVQTPKPEAAKPETPKPDSAGSPPKAPDPISLPGMSH